MDKTRIEALHILLADDQNLFREAMAVWLKRLSGKVIINHAASADETIQLLKDNHPFNLVIIDLHMSGMNGVFSVQNICQQAAPARTVIVSANTSPITVKACLETKIAGYILKSSDGETVLKAVQLIMNGGRYVPEGISIGGEKKWTEKQQHLLLCLAKGMSNKEISGKLFLSEGTVKQYVSHVLTELNISNRTQAGIKARSILGLSSDI